jgi:hypothetical protein
MKTGLAKRLLAAGSAAVMCLSLSLIPLARVYANEPYFKVLGGDASTGGWFSDAAGTSCTTSANFQDNTYKNDVSYGGIYAFAQNPGAGYEGSSSQYAAFSLGLIDNGTSPDGFYSGAANNQTNNNYLSFANITSLTPKPGNYTGGLWGGSTKNAAQCIPDYYDTKMPTMTTPLSGALGNNVSGVAAYTANASASPSFTLLSNNTKVAAGADISVFVNGNVYIDHNITYANHNAANAPRFVLVAQGSIYIDPAVSTLEGLYIAQPAASTLNSKTAVTDDTGMVWTCHDPSTALPSSSYIVSNCNNNLSVNGGVIAKQVNLLRMAGDVGDNNTNPAEQFNFTPEMVTAGPFFPTDGDITGTGNPQPIFQSLLSLPPVF